jgi:hypothetical protein
MTKTKRVWFRSRHAPSWYIVLDPSQYVVEKVGMTEKRTFHPGLRVQFENYMYSTTDKQIIEMLRAKLSEKGPRGRIIGPRKYQFDEVPSPQDEARKALAGLQDKVKQLDEEAEKEAEDLQVYDYCDEPGCDYGVGKDLSPAEKKNAMRLHKTMAHGKK